MFLFRVLYALVWNLLIFGGLLFLPAGTLNWWHAWVFLGVISVNVIATMVGVFQKNEGLWKERLKPPVQPEQPLADKIITILLILACFSLIAFIPLDVFRFHLLGKPSAIVSGFGLLLLLLKLCTGLSFSSEASCGLDNIGVDLSSQYLTCLRRGRGAFIHGLEAC
jgi:hypothetical protein